MNRSIQNISIGRLGLNDSEELDVRVIVVEDWVLVTDGVKIVAVSARNFSFFREVSVDVKN